MRIMMKLIKKLNSEYDTHCTRAEHDLSLDSAKLCAIFFVILYHFYWVCMNFLEKPSFLSYFHYFFRGIAACGVPLFFLVNGALLFNRTLDLKRHIKKMITIFILTALWNIILIFLMMPLTQEYLNAQQLLDSIKNYKIGWTNHLWFMNTLLYVYFFFPFLKLAKDKDETCRTHYLLFFFCFAFIMTFGNTFFSIPIHISKYFTVMKEQGVIPPGYFYNLNSYDFFEQINPFRNTNGYALVYFIAGGYLYSKWDILKSKVKSWHVFFILPSCLLLTGLYGILLSIMTEAVWDTVWHNYSSIFILPAASALFFAFLKTAPKRPLLKKLVYYIGSNSLGIYFIHRYLGLYTEQYFRKLPFSDTLLLNLCFCIGLLLLSLVICMIGRKIPVLRRLFSL